eukprot:3940895-Rhodomonas_salina.13
MSPVIRNTPGTWVQMYPAEQFEIRAFLVSIPASSCTRVPRLTRLRVPGYPGARVLVQIRFGYPMCGVAVLAFSGVSDRRHKLCFAKFAKNVQRSRSTSWLALLRSRSTMMNY